MTSKYFAGTMAIRSLSAGHQAILVAGVSALLFFGGCSKPTTGGEELVDASTSDGIDKLSSSLGSGDDQSDVGFAPPLNVGKNSAGSGAFAPPIAGNPASSAASVASDLELPAETFKQQLTDFLGAADREIQRLGTTQVGPQNRDAVINEINRVAVLKQQAAERLLETPDIDHPLREIATRARMQAFSHRAAFGDLQAAEALEQYAKDSLSDPSPEIVRDSRTILIGFALERLQGGVTTEPTEVLALVEDLANNSQPLNASSAKVMQRAMIILNQYGYGEAAETVRTSIETAFSNTADPNLAGMVADVLAAARFNRLESMRSGIYEATEQPAEQWSIEAESVAIANPDLLTLQYLASLALQLEAVGRNPAADAIYASIEKHYLQSSDQSLANAATEAIRGYEIRKEMIGKPVDITSESTLSGQPLPENYLSGQIILMPFWAIEQFDSLAPIGGLEEIVQLNPGKVKILGVNMDVTPAGRKKASELASYEMPWPNLAADPAGSAANPFTSPIAKQFGIVSIPTVVVLDQQSRVAAIALGPETIQQIVTKLLAQ